MILPDFVLPGRANQCWNHSGVDSLENCLDRQHFLQYPHEITYSYNSRGFRDSEWPTTLDELKNAVWCLGDSFTVGLGSPLDHTWPRILQQVTQRRTINVSMDGASNNWIARKAQRVLEEIKPTAMILHWSYVARRELSIEDVIKEKWTQFYQDIRDPSWPDCDHPDQISNLPDRIQHEIKQEHSGWMTDIADDQRRTLQSVRCSEQEDINNTLHCIDLVNQASGSTRIIHSFVPDFVSADFKGVVESQIAGAVIPEFQRLDLARDGHHYDRLTSQYLVDRILPLLT